MSSVPLISRLAGGGGRRWKCGTYVYGFSVCHHIVAWECGQEAAGARRQIPEISANTRGWSDTAEQISSHARFCWQTTHTKRTHTIMIRTLPTHTHNRRSVFFHNVISCERHIELRWIFPSIMSREEMMVSSVNVMRPQLISTLANVKRVVRTNNVLYF